MQGKNHIPVITRLIQSDEAHLTSGQWGDARISKAKAKVEPYHKSLGKDHVQAHSCVLQQSCFTVPNPSQLCQLLGSCTHAGAGHSLALDLRAYGQDGADLGGEFGVLTTALAVYSTSNASHFLPSSLL